MISIRQDRRLGSTAGHAAAKIKELGEKWQKMDYRVSIVEDM